MRIHFRVFLYALLLILCSCKKENSLTLRFDPKINKQNVRIMFEVDSYVPMMEIFNGETQFAIPNEYGENDWYFTYRNLKGSRRHFKTNRNNTHAYTFEFKEVNGKYFVDMDIKGVNDMKRRIELK